MCLFCVYPEIRSLRRRLLQAVWRKNLFLLNMNYDTRISGGQKQDHDQTQDFDSEDDCVNHGQEQN